MKIIIMHATTKPRRKPEEKKSDEKKFDAGAIKEAMKITAFEEIRKQLPTTVESMVALFVLRLMDRSKKPVFFNLSPAFENIGAPYFGVSIRENGVTSAVSLGDYTFPDLTVENLQEMFMKLMEIDFEDAQKEAQSAEA